ncbi:GATA zinc finger domain-containing protein 8 [Aphidius gifuensis]|uniref:GATA zinc finger domain-containing protein 8 n=1 Tax=Aphidius gifuensis TaxID=684658 RepID=UPI001CDCFDE2|nr:GATA zinc finger domain-containing protein 8 [Aphidius gifuensis]
MTTTKYRKSQMRPDYETGFRLLNDDHQQQQRYYHNVNNNYDYKNNNNQPLPRAPEPYKISSSSTTLSRAHRRSSFVIITENEQSNNHNEIIDNSPTNNINGHLKIPLSPSRIINRGRSSPFRPRGFKGPLPHAQSRPPSPPPSKPTHRRRYIKPKSLSQGNSPRKQSLIPQPRGGQITMRNKITIKQPSEGGHWDRRDNNKKIITNNNINTKIPRSNSLKFKLSQQQIRRPLIESTKTKLINNNNKQNKLLSNKIKPPKQAIKSPTKIPIRNSLLNHTNERFVQVANIDKNNINIDNKNSNNNSNEKLNNNDNLSPIVTDESSVIIAGNNSINNKNDKKNNDNLNDDIGLVDLLKQSSGASGTSSVVNAATTTAVQPLRIDASTILPQEVTEIKNIINNDKPDNSVNKLSIINNGGEKIIVVVKIKDNSNDNDEIKNTKLNSIDTNKQANNDTIDLHDSNNTNHKDNHQDIINKLNAIDNNNITEEKNKQDNQQTSSTTATTTTAIVKNDNSNINNSSNHGKHDSQVSLKSNDLSINSIDSIKSADTGVSLNTVRGVSSAREKHGTHVVNNNEEIETLSGNITKIDNENNEPAVIQVTNNTTGLNSIDDVDGNKNLTKIQKLRNWKNSIVKRYRERYRNMKCFHWNKINKQKKKNIEKTTNDPINLQKKKNICSRFTAAFCRNFRRKSKIAPAESTNCCRKDGGCCKFLCKKPSWCRWPSCCKSICSCSCCRRRDDEKSERSRSIRAKHSLTSIAPPQISAEQKSKIPEVLVEHSSVMRGAIPCLPVPLAWFCLIWNILLPGSGTIWSGIFNLCVGQPRFAVTTSARGRFGAFIVNIIVGISQLFTVLFCLVGWGWSIWWGVTMLRLARKWKRFKASEAINGDPESRDGGGVLPAPGVPVQALRGGERAR